MVRLDRTSVMEPSRWSVKVDRALVDAELFRKKARAFEQLVLNGKKRRAGFAAYAGSVVFFASARNTYDFPATWRKVPALKKALAQISDGHCAYCQRCEEDGSYGHVEHFKPKFLFPTLAYAIDNYFYSCERCNIKKLNKWPATGAYVRPDVLDPAKKFVFKRNGTVRAAVAGDGEAEATILDFGLDRKPLNKHRRKVIKAHLKALDPILTMPGLTVVQRKALAAPHLVARLSRFSEAINQNVRRAWQAAFPEVAL